MTAISRPDHWRPRDADSSRIIAAPARSKMRFEQLLGIALWSLFAVVLLVVSGS
jgi:hypothetical protein